MQYLNRNIVRLTSGVPFGKASWPSPRSCLLVSVFGQTCSAELLYPKAWDTRIPGSMFALCEIDLCLDCRRSQSIAPGRLGKTPLPRRILTVPALRVDGEVEQVLRTSLAQARRWASHVARSLMRLGHIGARGLPQAYLPWHVESPSVQKACCDDSDTYA